MSHFGPSVTARQPRLFHLESSLSVKFGSAFFRSIPSQPGVYFFFDRDDMLLYIGQSADLRSRVGSYRHVTPEKNPKRTVRLVARTTRIEWELCDSTAAAIERERVLLLARRPPVNRAGGRKGVRPRAISPMPRVRRAAPKAPPARPGASATVPGTPWPVPVTGSMP